MMELNTFVWLNRKRREAGRALTLDEVSDAEWESLKQKGFDYVWLMGVWKRSPGARKIALTHPNQIKIYDALLPGWTEADITGSPYAVYGYERDPFLGPPSVLVKIKKKLNAAGLKVILDFVPNHLAFDHPWTLSHPELFVRASKTDLKNHPGWFFKTEGGAWLAHGRDPYFEPWIDTVQVNFFSAEMREKMTGELLHIAAVADGVRCDMAMLGLNEVFSRVWGETVRLKAPAEEFWKEAIRTVKARYPKFLFMAEVYWDLEKKLLDLGFDLVYDKKFYDQLRAGSADGARRHLLSQEGLETRMVRFIENHDEMRAAEVFLGERSKAAALACALQPGMRFFHDGQAEGAARHIPVQLARGPEEPVHEALKGFYEKLWNECSKPLLKKGLWQILQPRPSWDADPSYHHIMVTAWTLGEDWRLGVLNLAEGRCSARIPWVFPDLSENLYLEDLFSGVVYQRSQSELKAHGLYVELGPGEVHFFKPLRHYAF